MAHEAYTTSVYPYPAAMWDSAAHHLEDYRGWIETLLVCPDPPAVCNQAMTEMANRGVDHVACLITHDSVIGFWIMRISKLSFLDPRWDDAERRLKEDPQKKATFVVVDTTRDDPNVMIEDARAAMAERGLEVGIGYSSDATSMEGLLRIELVE